MDTNTTKAEVADSVLQPPQRNYQIDVLKLIFTLFVFFFHTWPFSNISISSSLGWMSVSFFFVVSGFLMVSSINRKNPTSENAGQRSISFVFNRFKGLSFHFCLSIVIGMFIFVGSYDSNHISVFYEHILQLIPQVLGISDSGLNIRFNGPLWYISAMLLVMIPLCYMLIKKKDFTIYVFSPLAAMLILGFLYQNDPQVVNLETWYFISLESVLRALSGLCFGIVSWVICEKISNISTGKSTRVVFTIVEALLYVIFFYTWLVHDGSDERSFFAISILIPIIVAIVFSKKSYICELFKMRWMKRLSKVSLLIYLYHNNGRIIVERYMPETDYVHSVLYMALVTAGFCLFGCLLETLIKAVRDRCKKSSEKEGA